MKRIRITIEMDSHFVQLLMANVQLSGLRKKDELTPSQQLALLALAEARGALEEEVHALILPAWRPHIHAVSRMRAVEDQSL